MNLNEIHELLKKHNYEVKVQLHKGGFSVNIPERKFHPICENHTIFYTINKRTNQIIIHELDNNEIKNEEIIHCPDYAVVAFVLKEISVFISSLDFSGLLIKFYDKNNNEINEDFFVSKLRKRNVDKDAENKLFEILSQGLASGVTEDLIKKAQEQGVLEGCRVLFNLTEEFLG